MYFVTWLWTCSTHLFTSWSISRSWWTLIDGSHLLLYQFINNMLCQFRNQFLFLLALVRHTLKLKLLESIIHIWNRWLQLKRTLWHYGCYVCRFRLACVAINLSSVIHVKQLRTLELPALIYIVPLLISKIFNEFWCLIRIEQWVGITVHQFFFTIVIFNIVFGFRQD